MPERPEPPQDAAALHRVGLHQLRFTPSSLALGVAIVLGVLVVARALAAATRPLGWLVVAVVLAGLLYPIVDRLARAVPRGLAVAIVAIGSVALVAGVVYGSIDDLRQQTDRIERAAPEAARDLEESERFGEAAREARLEERVDEFVEELPDRLRGGTPVEAVRAAATRGVAFLATFVLTIFLLVSGPRFVQGGLAQIRNDIRRSRLERVLHGAYGKAWRYVVLTLGRAVLAGVFTWVVCGIADVPGEVLLGVWVAVWSIVPLIGVVVGGLAVTLLAVPMSLELAGSLFVVFLAYQVAEVFLVQRRVERRSIHIGPFLTLIAAMFGLELYGIGGMAVAVIAMILAVSVAEQLAPTDESDLTEAAGAVVTGDPARGAKLA